MNHTLLISALCLLLLGCSDCEKCKNEEYLEEDSLTWNSHRISNIGIALQDLNLKDLETLDQPAYRMFYHHAFDEYEKFIQISKTNSGYELTENTFDVTYTDDQWGALPIKTVKISISEVQWNEFEAKIYESKFWTLPKPMNQQGLDGYIVVLEGYRPEAQKCNKRTYQLICRWSPEPGPLRDAIKLLLGYTK